MALTVEEKTSAAKKLIGFDFQYYYALLELLKLKKGEELGIEIKDDIHIVDKNGKLILLQLKHTLQKNANDYSINLTERDYDLWHTISNWINLILDPEEGRSNPKEQLEFINNTTFILATNKSGRNKNKYFTILNEFNLKQISIEKFIQYLSTLYSTTADKDIKEYILKLITVDKIVLNNFLLKLEFRLDEDNIIEKIKDILATDLVLDKPDSEDMFYEIAGRFKVLEYLKIKAGFNETYSKEQVNNNLLKGPLNKLRNQKFLVSELRDYECPENIFEEPFAKQLHDIDKDLDEIIKRNYQRQLCLTNIKKWSERKPIITTTERDNFFVNAESKWQMIHGPRHRRCSTCSDEENLFNV